MLTSIRIENFRAFKNHYIPLAPLTIIVGPNNAGKSTVIEALALVSLALDLLQVSSFSDPPEWLKSMVPDLQKGVSTTLSAEDFNLLSVFHRYGDPPAVITATFDDQSKVEMYLGTDGKFFTLFEHQGGNVRSPRQAARVHIPAIGVLPQIGPLSRREKVVDDNTLIGTLQSPVRTGYFRNQLAWLTSYYSDFVEVAENSWNGLRIRELQVPERNEDNDYDDESESLALLIQDGDFVAEVGWMGHGLQIWLQVMWFLTRKGAAEAIVLDEPDVYMHPDLQRRLIRLLRNRHQQIILATHSVEMMAEVPPECVLLLDRHSATSRFASSLPGVQAIVDLLGGVHNLQLARLWTSRRCLLVEGKDVAVLKHLQNTLHPHVELPIDAIPNVQFGGWGNWMFALGAAQALKSAAASKVNVYCILDRDYHPNVDLASRTKEAAERDLQLHIWSRKEIENYLIVPAAIQRIIARSVRAPSLCPAVKEIEDKIDEFAESYKEEIFDAMGAELLAKDRAGGFPVARKATKKRFDDLWATPDGRLQLIPGKKVISDLAGWAQAAYGVSFGVRALAEELSPAEIPTEIVDVLTAIEHGVKFSQPVAM